MRHQDGDASETIVFANGGSVPLEQRVFGLGYRYAAAWMA